MDQQQQPAAPWRGWREIETKTGFSSPTLKRLGAPFFKIGGATLLDPGAWSAFLREQAQGGGK
jgi:hypothetical protein